MTVMTSSLASRLVERIRQQRLSLGWTQTDAAARAGISARMYQRLERNATVTLATLDRVLSALGLTLTLVASDGGTAPVPDARLGRKRGLRHANAASVPPRPPVRVAGGAPLPVAGRPAATPGPKRTPPVAGDRITAVLKAQRNQVLLTVRTVVMNALNNYTAYPVVQNFLHTARGLEDEPAFVAAVEAQLDALNAENIVGYGLSAADYQRWAAGWKPERGIVDIAAGPTG